MGIPLKHPWFILTALLVLTASLAAGCTQSAPAPSSPSAAAEQTIPFDAIQTDAEVYNIGEVVQFELVSKTPGRGKCDDHPCSYRLLKLAENGTWQFLPGQADPWSRAPGTVEYEPGCYPGHFPTGGWTAGQYRIQYACGVYRIFTVRDVPVIAGL